MAKTGTLIGGWMIASALAIEYLSVPPTMVIIAAFMVGWYYNDKVDARSR